MKRRNSVSLCEFSPPTCGPFVNREGIGPGLPKRRGEGIRPYRRHESHGLGPLSSNSVSLSSLLRRGSGHGGSPWRSTSSTG